MAMMKKPIVKAKGKITLKPDPKLRELKITPAKPGAAKPIIKTAMKKKVI
jgi:hypothetical protein